MIRTQSANTAFMVMGNFNDFDTQVIEEHTLLSQIITKSTGETMILDKILTDIADQNHEPDVGAPIACSDHARIMLPQIQEPVHCRTDTFSIFTQCGSSVRSFRQWITEMDWSDMDNIIDGFNSYSRVGTCTTFSRSLLPDV